MVYDMWKFDDSMDMIKQTYVTGSTWNNKTKVDEGCRASLVRIDVSGYPDPCVIAFGYRKYYAGGGDMASDWQHLFSFGTHVNNGGDNPTAPLAFYNTRGVPGCILNVELPKFGLSIEDTWSEMNAYIIHLHDSMIDYYFNNNLLYSMRVGAMPHTFYFNGSGCYGEHLGVFSYLLIGDNLSDGLFIRYPTYFDGKDLYGILKKDDSE